MRDNGFLGHVTNFLNFSFIHIEINMIAINNIKDDHIFMSSNAIKTYNDLLTLLSDIRTKYFVNVWIKMLTH